MKNKKHKDCDAELIDNCAELTDDDDYMSI